jgi:hypothetical protein
MDPYRRLTPIDIAFLQRLARLRSPMLDRTLVPLSRAADHSVLWLTIAAAMAALGQDRTRERQCTVWRCSPPPAWWPTRPRSGSVFGHDLTRDRSRRGGGSRRNGPPVSRPATPRQRSRSPSSPAVGGTGSRSCWPSRRPQSGCPGCSPARPTPPTSSPARCWAPAPAGRHAPSSSTGTRQRSAPVVGKVHVDHQLLGVTGSSSDNSSGTDTPAQPLMAEVGQWAGVGLFLRAQRGGESPVSARGEPGQRRRVSHLREADHDGDAW